MEIKKAIKYCLYGILIFTYVYFAWIKPYQNDPEQYKIYFEEANNKHDFFRALEILKANIDKKTSFEHHYLFGIAYQNLMIFDSAKLEFQNAINIDSNQVNPYLRLSRILYLEEKNYLNAEKLLKRAIQIDSLNIEVQNELGTFYEETGKIRQSKAQFLKILNHNKKNTFALHNLGMLYLRKNQLDSAEFFLIQSLNTLEKNSVFKSKIFESLGVLYFTKKDTENSKTHFLLSHESNPTNENSNFHLGLIFGAENQHEIALKYYDKCIFYGRKSDYKVFFNRAHSLYKMEKYEKALVDLDNAIKLNPKSKESYGLRGNVKFMMEDDAGACKDFQKALDMGSKEYSDVIKKYCR